jgi:hypothetical protein
LTYDLLLASEYRRLMADPSLIRQECDARRLLGLRQTSPIIIDEVQTIPDLLGDGVETMPWRDFLRQLWAGEIAP